MLLFWYKMEIPLEVILSFFLSHSAMLTVMTFESREISLETVCGYWYQRIIEIMEHIRQSSQEHTTGSLDVTEDIASLSPIADLSAEINLPLGDSIEKLVTICRGPDFSNLEKNLSEPPGVCGSGRHTAPGQTLALHMNKTSLHCNTRPELTKNLNHFRIAIHRKAIWTQSSLYQRLKESPQLSLRVLRNTILTSYDSVRLSIHQGNKTPRTVKKRSIQDKMLEPFQAEIRLKRCLFEMVIEHTVKFTRALPALVYQLPDRITLNNPQLKPVFFTGSLAGFILQISRVSARRTEPSSFSFSIMTISPKKT